MINPQELRDAYQTARRDLLAEREPDGHWVGQLSGSALSTATAVSALSVVASNTSDDSREKLCRELAARGVDHLIQTQNDDGGWGDTDKSFSNISTTMLVRAFLHLAGVTEKHAGLLERTKRYLDGQGGIEGLRQRYGKDKTFVVPILTNCAIAGLVPWREVSPLPFELAVLPHTAWSIVRLPVVSYAIPALVAIGQARYFHEKPRNPVVRVVRRLCVGKSLSVLQGMQPASGGFLEAVPLTSFVIMALASTGRVDHPVVISGLKFLMNSIRENGEWPIDTNLATWNTPLSIGALAAANGEVGALGCLDWLLACQHQGVHPFTHAAPGGWGWTDLSGAVPDADDTSSALLALAVLGKTSSRPNQIRIQQSAAAGARWLLDLQNKDGGWPTFCRGWGTLPFDRSGADLTAHAIRALHAWESRLDDSTVTRAIPLAIHRGFAYLARQQREDGSWLPLWFGNQHSQGDINPTYGSSRVLAAYRDLDRLATDEAQRGLRWLAASLCEAGPWNDPPQHNAAKSIAGRLGVEETALAVEALLSDDSESGFAEAAEAGLAWLIDAVRSGRHRETAPIGFYFAKLWYHEKMYPLTFTVSALGTALRKI